MEIFSSPAFWIAVGQIVMIDILLGGDNAVVIALACRKLPAKQRTQGILWGTAGAIILRVILIFFALQLLAIPFLKIVGALLLVWIGVKLLMPEHEDGHGNITGSDKLWMAVKTVIIADLVMSVDNVIAIAGAAEASNTGHTMPLVIFGVLISIPIIIWGSQMVLKLMDRFPMIITLGGMLLGWIAGTMLVTDPALTNPDIMSQMPKIVPTDAIRYGAGIAGALLVFAFGKWLTARSKAATTAATPATPGAVHVPGLKRVLLAVDGSDDSLKAVHHTLALRQDLRDPAAFELHLVNVQRPLSGDVSTFIASQTLEEYYKERSDETLASARALLDAAKCAYQLHEKLGDPAPTIAALADQLGCNLIVMGTRGMGAVASALIGSVAQGVVSHATVPVLLTK